MEKNKKFDDLNMKLVETEAEKISNWQQLADTTVILKETRILISNDFSSAYIQMLTNTGEIFHLDDEWFEES